jgi:hypothetical protein
MRSLKEILTDKGNWAMLIAGALVGLFLKWYFGI